MKIAVLNLTGGGMSGGYRAYLDEVLPRLSAMDGVDKVFCSVPDVGVEWAWKERVSSFLFTPPWPRVLADRASLRRALNDFAPDIVFAPFERRVPVRSWPTVTMVQNVAPLASYASWPILMRTRLSLQRAAARDALRRSDAVIVPSHAARAAVERVCRLSSTPVHTIPYGVSACVRSSAQRRPAGMPQEVGDNFVLAVGSLEPYRGVEDVLRACAWRGSFGCARDIVVAGAPSCAQYAYWIQTLARTLGIERRVHFLGALSREELAWSFAHARACVFSSRLESFGLTGLEALSYGALCVVADTPVAREVFGDAASWYPAGSAPALAGTLNDVCRLRTEDRARASQAAIARAHTFSWDETVRQTVEVLRRACQ